MDTALDTALDIPRKSFEYIRMVMQQYQKIQRLVKEKWSRYSWMFVPLCTLYQFIKLRIYCFLTGEPISDEEKDNARASLIKNDVYRDRLLVKEIELLLDVAQALELSYRKRHAFFVQFLKLDWTRRSTVSTRQLLLYCNIRKTRLGQKLFQVKYKKSIRKLPNRLDIVQLLSIAFSIGTLTPDQVRLSSSRTYL